MGGRQAASSSNPPFAAFECSLGKSYYVGFTLGGLAVSIDGEVLRAESAPVPGLYAAGACASNIAQDGKGYSSGTCIGEASFFGRRAGRHTAAIGAGSGWEGLNPLWGGFKPSSRLADGLRMKLGSRTSPGPRDA